MNITWCVSIVTYVKRMHIMSFILFFIIINTNIYLRRGLSRELETKNSQKKEGFSNEMCHASHPQTLYYKSFCRLCPHYHRQYLKSHVPPTAWGRWWLSSSHEACLWCTYYASQTFHFSLSLCSSVQYYLDLLDLENLAFGKPGQNCVEMTVWGNLYLSAVTQCTSSFASRQLCDIGP